MKQRLGIAVALLGDPEVLLFDEPVNGLDPEGIRWIRELMRSLAAEGRTVLISSHLMSEMALTADLVVVIGRGRLIAETSVADLSSRFKRDVFVRSPRADELTHAMTNAGATVRTEPSGGLSVSGIGTEEIADLALERRIPVYELTPRSASLEEAYMELTDESVEYRSVS
jgi:ABC-2 type transport system ATP-binding protein